MELGLFVTPQQGASHDDLVQAARAAEDHDFFAFVRSDHYLANGDVIAPPGPSDAWMSLAWLAAHTSRIRLGTMLSPVTFRTPGQLALAVAQVDQMSGGRVMLGLGAGWHAREHAAFGIAFPPLGERFERLEEQLAIVTGFWSTDAAERFSFAGRHYQLVDVPTLPKPVQSPRPPIIVGGKGRRRTPRIAATYADEFNVPPMTSPQEAGELFAGVRAQCERLGRDPASLVLSACLTTFGGRDGADLSRRASAHPGEFAHTDLSGTPDAIAEQLTAYRAAGATRVYLRIVDLHDLDHIMLLGEVATALGDVSENRNHR